MSDTLAALKLFVRVARTGGFTKAGRELGYSQPSASRVIAALEREVGTALLTRTTRAVRLTEAGADYLARIEPVLEALEDANHHARGTGELRGLLRVGLSTTIAMRAVIPDLPAFVNRHPALRLDLLMEDGRQDLLRDGVDVALRFGDLADSGATAKKIGTNPRVVVASAAYLARAGRPTTPAELAGHAIIFGPASSGAGAWSFEKGGRTVTVKVTSRVQMTVNEGSTAAAVAGLGIVSTGLWGCRAELASGALVRVLESWKMASLDLHAVFAAGRAAKPSARAFVDHLVRTLARSSLLVPASELT